MGCFSNAKVAPAGLVPEPVKQNRPRKNGFTLPFDSVQVFSWFVIAFFAGTFYGVEVLVLPLVPMLVFAVIMGIVLIALLVLLFYGSCVDSSVDACQPHVYDTNRVIPLFDRSKRRHVIMKGYCCICEINVPVGTKHCKSCNKCIDDFDHHCLWLNNCVGSKNYRIFLSAVAVAVFGMVIMNLISLYAFVFTFVWDKLPDAACAWWIPGETLIFQFVIAFKICLEVAGFCLWAPLLYYNRRYLCRPLPTANTAVPV